MIVNKEYSVPISSASISDYSAKISNTKSATNSDYTRCVELSWCTRYNYDSRTLQFYLPYKRELTANYNIFDDIEHDCLDDEFDRTGYHKYKTFNNYLDDEENEIDPISSAYVTSYHVNQSWKGGKFHFPASNKARLMHNCINKSNKEENKTMNKIYNALINNKFTKSLINDAREYAVSSIKEKLGKEFEIDQSHCPNAVKFIAKYDPMRKHRTIKTYGDNIMYLNSVFVITFEKYAYAYVMVGDYRSEIDILANRNMNVDMKIFVFGKKSGKYIRRLSKLIYSDNSAFGIYTISQDNYSSGSFNVSYSPLNIRNVSSMYYSNGEVQKIMSHVAKFNADKEFYKSRQLLYKTGILLYGKPGTGKSSIISLIASETQRSVANISLADIQNIDLAKVANSINIDTAHKYIVALEDIDTVFNLNRENAAAADDKSGTTLDEAKIINKLLQFLDSNISPMDVIFVATTNHLDKLDEAILRRFDIKVDVRGLLLDDAIKYMMTYDMSEQEAKQLIESEYPKDKIYNNLYTQKFLQDIAISKKQNKDMDIIKEIYVDAE